MGYGALSPLQEGEKLLPPTRQELWPIISQDVASIRQGDRVKHK
jgi:hypothetical protein